MTRLGVGWQEVIVLAAVLWGLIMWIGGCSVVAWATTQKHWSAAGWFFQALLFSPLFSIIAVAAVPTLRGGRRLAALDRGALALEVRGSS